MLNQAMTIYEKYNRPNEAARMTIARLVTEAGERFDLKRWETICKAQRRRGRADLAAAEYRRLGRQAGRVARPAVDRAAYAALEAETAAAEAERARVMDKLFNQRG